MNRLVPLVGLALVGCKASAPTPEVAVTRPTYALNAADEALLDSVQHRAFEFFRHESDSATGLVRDRTQPWSPASIAATGFGLSAWAVGAERGWMTRDEAVHRTLAALRFFAASDQTGARTGTHGFYYHFLSMDRGERMWNSELSTVDTALLLLGARFAAQYFDRDDPAEREIGTLTDSLTNRVRWDWATLPEQGEFGGSISLGWSPEKGFIPIGWVGYNEGLLVYVLAAGSAHPPPVAAYERWLSFYKWREPSPGLGHVAFGPMFGHQYPQVWLDLRGRPDRYLRERGLDYFENSRRATLVQRGYAMTNPGGWAGYDSLTWGLTACDGPGDTTINGKKYWGYDARGTSGPDQSHDDGTIAPTAALGSVVFAPEIVVPTVRAMVERYGKRGLWGPYGLRDAFNPTADWIDRDYLGIDQGPIVLMIENLRTGLVWRRTMRDSVVQRGLRQLGFSEVP